MVDRFPNLPGIVADIADGNLAPDVPESGPVTVIIGTGSSGPSGRLATANGAGGASRIFGAGTLMPGAIEAFQGGAGSVSGFRVLSTSGKLSGIGGGYSIESLSKGSRSLSDLKILLDTTQGNDSKVLKVYSAASGAQTFASDGSVDLGVLVGSGAIADDKLSISEEIANHNGAATGDYINADGKITIANLLAGALGPRVADGTGDAYIQVTQADGTVKEARITAAINGEIEIVVADKFGADIAGAPVKIFSRSTPVSVESAMSSRLGDAAGRDLSLINGSNSNGLSPRSIQATSGIKDTGAAEHAPLKMNLFEGLRDASAALESADIDFITMPGVYLDDEHVKHSPSTLTAATAEAITAGQARSQLKLNGNLAASITNGGSWLVVTQAKGSAFGDGHDGDSLVRCARILSTELSGGNTVAFLDRELSLSIDASGSATGVTPTVELHTDASKLFFYREEGAKHLWYPTASDPDGNLLHEVNFAYELASFCQEKTNNESFCTSSIGVNPPSSHFAPSAVNTWYGKAPTKNIDTGAISSNGTGLLGNRLLAGGVGYTPGFFQTQSGYMDDSTVLLDSNENKIDMGKYLSIVASYVTLSNASDSTGLGYINSGASVYLGKTSALAPWSATTGKELGSGLAVPSRLAKRRQNALAGLGYVTLDQPRGQQVSVVDGPSAAMSGSDFTRNMTSRMVGEAITRVRAVGRPYLGEPLSAPRKAALDNAIGSALRGLQADSDAALESFNHSLSQTPREAVTGIANLTLSLKVIGELRRIIVTVSLSL
jgi:hypothetical protein